MSAYDEPIETSRPIGGGAQLGHDGRFTSPTARIRRRTELPAAAEERLTALENERDRALAAVRASSDRRRVLIDRKNELTVRVDQARAARRAFGFRKYDPRGNPIGRDHDVPPELLAELEICNRHLAAAEPQVDADQREWAALDTLVRRLHGFLDLREVGK